MCVDIVCLQMNNSGDLTVLCEPQYCVTGTRLETLVQELGHCHYFIWFFSHSYFCFLLNSSLHSKRCNYGTMVIRSWHIPVLVPLDITYHLSVWRHCFLHLTEHMCSHQSHVETYSAAKWKSWKSEFYNNPCFLLCPSRSLVVTQFTTTSPDE